MTISRFRLGHAANGEWLPMARSCLAQMDDLPPQANVGFVYVTDFIDEELPLVVDLLQEQTGIEHWIGTIGMGVMGAGEEYFSRPAIVTMAGNLPEDSFCLLRTVDKPGEPLPADVGKWVERAKPSLGVVHADPNNAYISDILNSISDDTDALFVGGLTASRGHHSQIIGTHLTEGGVSGILFSQDVHVTSGLSQGCSPVGAVHKVTEARDNILITLDNRPALDVLMEDIGETSLGNLQRAAARIHIARAIPGDESGDYLVRNLTGVDPNRKLVVIGDRVQRGDRLMFVKRDGPEALKDLERMLNELSARISRPPRAALYHSCVARGPNLFGAHSREMGMVQQVLGSDVPVAGFFANGEISRNRLYGYTAVLTVLH